MSRWAGAGQRGSDAATNRRKAGPRARLLVVVPRWGDCNPGVTGSGSVRSGRAPRAESQGQVAHLSPGPLAAGDGGQLPVEVRIVEADRVEAGRNRSQPVATESVDGHCVSMNHKRRRPKHQRAGCLMCKPHKDERLAKEPRQPVVAVSRILDEVEEAADQGLADFLMWDEECWETRHEREIFELLLGEYLPEPLPPKEEPILRKRKDRRHFCGGKSGLEHVWIWVTDREFRRSRDLVLCCERCGKMSNHFLSFGRAA